MQCVKAAFRFGGEKGKGQHRGRDCSETAQTGRHYEHHHQGIKTRPETAVMIVNLRVLFNTHKEHCRHPGIDDHPAKLGFTSRKFAAETPESYQTRLFPVFWLCSP